MAMTRSPRPDSSSIFSSTVFLSSAEMVQRERTASGDPFAAMIRFSSNSQTCPILLVSLVNAYSFSSMPLKSASFGKPD